MIRHRRATSHVTPEGRNRPATLRHTPASRSTPTPPARQHPVLDSRRAGYLAGQSGYQSGLLFGINRQTVSLHLKRRGVAMRMQGLDESDRPETELLRAEGWSLVRLGQRFRDHGSSVRNFLMRASQD
jgi:hypothetical protein